ncbi:hypothetical protein GI584_17205 [Gracilibacillus salitolerans]|uniref:Uncharacterized protein n=1 Tax=Gracilibacillus salitolerans TaxID=2663022 RepID=A0A5Q2TPC1_9BACI|nr:hypothetical protein [Gracilibacillus salitolerans]QGH35680.1 hypothetical protein GI584_17205 [Gracilibacillus salitolerans]
MMNKHDIPEELKQKLDEFEVDVPEILLKKSLSQRIANWFYAPAKNPADYFSRQWTPLRIALFPVIILLCSLPMLFI